VVTAVGRPALRTVRSVHAALVGQPVGRPQDAPDSRQPRSGGDRLRNVDGPRCIKISRRIDAPARRIFALLADPARHEAIDGSGTVRSARSPQLLTAEGQRFRMNTHREDRGGAYATDNIVTTYRPNRALGWATTYPDQEPLGYTHTYLLGPDGDDRTIVTQIYD
jgi:uncharacterized protein YndB with AHSA1/START domain